MDHTSKMARTLAEGCVQHVWRMPVADGLSIQSKSSTQKGESADVLDALLEPT